MTRHPWLALAGLALGVTVTNGFARFAYGLLLPAMRTELGWTYAQAGWLNTANAFGYLVGAVLTMFAIRRIPATQLFAFGLVMTTFTLLATGFSPEMWWQSALRILAGVFGAMSFATAGTLTTQLFPDDPRRNALAIAILFGTGGGLGIVLAGATLPPMLETFGPTAWPWGWIVIGAISLACMPLGLWAARHLRAGTQSIDLKTPLPLRAMLPEMAAYAAFGMGYIVYLTFLAAWMRDEGFGGLMVAATWMLMGLCLTLSPFLWRGIFARYASGLPIALVLTGIAAGSALPVLWPNPVAPFVSALVFGSSVFMAPGAVTNFARQNLPTTSVGPAVSLFTVVFACAQIIGPYVAGWLGDRTGDIGDSLIAAALVLLLGAGIALLQRPLGPVSPSATTSR